MEIKINPVESYQIDIPEKVDAKQFLGILSRLERIAKLLNKEIDFSNDKSLSLTNSKPADFYVKRNLTKERLKEFRATCGNRQEVIKLTESYYSDKKYINEVKKKYQITSVTYIPNLIYYLRTKFKLSPKDVGIIKFPTPGRTITHATANNKK